VRGARPGHADYIGSTTGILKYAVASPKREFIVVTEAGILHAMQKAAPTRCSSRPRRTRNCACNECPFMKMNTLEKVYLALRDLAPRLEMSESLLQRARVPIDRMLALS
jgi:quinolinate synthase